MSSEYIEFGGKKSTDFYLVIQKDGVQISQPEENRIEATLPFMNGFYDFSKMAGERTYKQRDITIKFSLSAKMKTNFTAASVMLSAGSVEQRVS